jgi:NADH:ubiquinone reductase (H+-translocating)
MRVVIVGAGYAGTIAANRVARKVEDARVSVVNPRSDFVERVRLHEEIAGTGRAATPLAGMLREGITTTVGAAETIGDGVVRLGDGSVLAFDHLVVAVGSVAEPLAGTIPVGTWEGAARAKAAFAALRSGATVTVLGGGLTGIETAAELAHARPEVTVRLVGHELATGLTDRARARVRRGLHRLGVEIVKDAALAVSDGGDLLQLESGGELESDLTLWAIVSGVPDLVRRSGLQVDGDGRAVVDPFLRSVDDPRIFVVGDCAAVPGARLCCATATPQGAHAGDVLARIARDRDPEPYSMGYTGQALSLGRHDGLVQASRRDGRARSTFIAGRPAAAAKETVSRYAKFSSQTAIYGWIGGPR